MNCPICEKSMTLRPEHAYIRGSHGKPYEFEVYECHSAREGFGPGEKYGRRCEETLCYQPASEPRGCPLVITGLSDSGTIDPSTISGVTDVLRGVDRAVCPAEQPGCRCQAPMAPEGATPAVDEDASRDSQ